MTGSSSAREETPLVDRFYELARRGEWASVLAGWHASPSFARECAHFVKPTSGWTFLHQAAFAGADHIVVGLISSGADAAAVSNAGETPADVARNRGHRTTATALAAATEVDGLWAPPRSPDHLPSSHRWDEARQRIAAVAMTVQYAGGLVRIAPRRHLLGRLVRASPRRLARHVLAAARHGRQLDGRRAHLSVRTRPMWSRPA